MKTISTLLAATLILISGCDGEGGQPGGAAPDPAVAFRSCAACHGPTGQGNRAMQAPSLANLDGWYISRQMNNFKSGLRGRHPKDSSGMQMASQAGILKNDAAIEAVVMHIDSFANINPGPTFSANPDAGRNLYSQTCAACHGPEGAGQLALNAPSLRGIEDWYLVKQYENFRQGIRGTHPDDIYGQQMQTMSTALTSEEEVRDVAAWLLSLGVDDGE